MNTKNTTTTATRATLATLLPVNRHLAWETFLNGETPSIRTYGPIALYVLQVGLDALAMLRQGVSPETVRECLRKHC